MIPDPIQVFVGFDSRQPVAYHTLAHSIFTRASTMVVVRPLQLAHLPISRRGLTDFTYSRFLVPWLSRYKGFSIFIDSDFLCLGDISELYDEAVHALKHMYTDVAVVKNKLRFEWPSMMVFRNYSCRKLSPKFVEDPENKLFDFSWAREVAELDPRWNHLVGYDSPNRDAQLIHFTQGIPCFPETKDSEYAAEWITACRAMKGTVSWETIMGNSVHARPVMERLAREATQF